MMYCDSLTPSEATLPILSFIAKRVINNTTSPSGQSTSESDIDLSFALKDFENLLSSLPASNDGIPLLEWYNMFLWNARSIDAFFMIFEDLEDLFAPTDIIADSPSKRPRQRRLTPRITLSATSLLGIFIRRTKVEFERLQFVDVMELWNDFVAYRGEENFYMKKTDYDVHDTQRSFEEIDFRSRGRIFDMIGNGTGPVSRKDERLSTVDVGHLLEFQIDGMQSMRGSTFLQYEV